MRSLNKPAKISLVALLLYVFLFPFCYFRHDDWLILGTAVKHLPQDWGLLWRATLFYSPWRQEIWFFRPFFKLLTYWNFQLFGFNHSLWLTEQLFLLLLTLLISASALYRLRKKSADVDLFLIAFLFCIPLHFGSLVWIGEGMMNIPQVLFLSVALFGFVWKETPTLFSIFFSLLGYIGALLCKESSVVFPGLLLLLSLSFRSLKKDRGQLALHFILSAVYLYVRFKFFAVNPGYHPQFDFVHFVRPLLLFIAVCFMGPALFCLVALVKDKRNVFKLFDLKYLFLFGGFVFLLILPHLGHWFFSPGWFFLPGFWAAWTFPLLLKDSQIFQKRYLLTAVLLFIASLTPLVVQLTKVGWLQWGQVQRQLHETIAHADPTNVSLLFVQECVNPNYPDSDLSRVAGSTDSIEHIWNLMHDKKIHVREVPCREQIPQHPTAKILHFTFPVLIME